MNVTSMTLKVLIRRSSTFYSVRFCLSLSFSV
uniref:Uncharacterized protein n=1 Tax=Parascaris equorum TaxID=6256 RepID=A0A914RGM1_PAREQ